MTSIVTAFFLALIGNSAIYTGLAFINATLLPTALEKIYLHTNGWIRLVIMSAVFSTFANYIFSKIYKLVDPATAGMIILPALVVVLVTKSLLLGVGALTPRLVLATLALACVAVWVSYELHKQV